MNEESEESSEESKSQKSDKKQELGLPTKKRISEMVAHALFGQRKKEQQKKAQFSQDEYKTIAEKINFKEFFNKSSKIMEKVAT